MANIADYVSRNADAKLGPVEQFFADISKIDYFKERLEALHFKQNCVSKIKELTNVSLLLIRFIKLLFFIINYYLF